MRSPRCVRSCPSMASRRKTYSRPAAPAAPAPVRRWLRNTAIPPPARPGRAAARRPSGFRTKIANSSPFDGAIRPALSPWPLGRPAFPVELTQPAFRRVFYCPDLVCVRAPRPFPGGAGAKCQCPDSLGGKAFVECAPDVFTAWRWRTLSSWAMAATRRWLLRCDMRSRPVALRLYVSCGSYHIFCRGNAGVWRFPCLRMIPQGQPQPHSWRRARFSGRCRRTSWLQVLRPTFASKSRTAKMGASPH